MPIIYTDEFDPATFPQSTVRQIYNGLDCCITSEVLTALRPLSGNAPNIIYDFERALQAPVLEMMQRGFRIDEYERRKGVALLQGQISHLDKWLQELAIAVWGKTLNPRSPKQLIDFFYSAMRLPEQWKNDKGNKRLSTDREALEKLEVYFYARPIVSTILEIRNLSKKLSVLETEIDPDGRMRTSYNIAGTECISGDSLIWTKGGLRTIKDIYETPHEVLVWNGSTFIAPARKVMYPNRVGKIIKLEGGYELKCSLNHPVKTLRGFVEAQNLTYTDRVELNIGLRPLFGQHALPRGEICSQLTEDFCELFGMLLADGSMNNSKEHYRCRLSNSDPYVRRRFLDLSLTVFNVVGSQSGDEAYFSDKKTVQGLVSLGFLADCGLGTASIKTIPTPLLRGKPNLIRALLRGLTLDSHITEKGLMFGTQSIKMQEQIQQCLLVLGICSVKLQTGNSIKLNVPKSYCGRFINMIGFVQESTLQKLAKLLNLRAQWHEPYRPYTKVTVEIRSIKEWQGDVYDLTMPDNSPPQYVANGITVHNTGRWSSSSNAFGTGTNLQNITPELRKIFVADPGHKLVGIDLEQAESREVGWQCGVLFNDWSYLDAAYSGDLHTIVTQQNWTKLPWTDDPKENKKIAEQPYYRHYSYRDMSKKLGHGSNYGGSPFTMARHAKIPTKMAEDFQIRYFEAFPGIPRWHRWVAQQLQQNQLLITPFGRRRHFFGRPNDDATLRESIAFVPQSSTGDRMNLGLFRIWRHMRDRVQLIAQVHDAVYFQFREGLDEREIIEEALARINVKLRHGDRTLIVPGEAKSGWNWGNWDEKSNPNGLKKFKGKDSRERLSGLDRIL